MRARIFCFLALLSSSAFSAEPVACPLILEEGAIKIVHPPAGWLGMSNSLARLTSGGLMRGHPDQMAYLKPEKMAKFEGGGAASNEFAPGEEKWLWCGYGGTSAIQVSKRLPDKATECTVTHRETKRDGITEMMARCTSRQL